MERETMSKDGRFLINNNMRLQSKHFCVVFHKVNYQILATESQFQMPRREVYHKSGIYSVMVQFDGRCFDIIYSDKTLWDNRQLQHWLRIRLRDRIIEAASKILPERLRYWEAEKGLKAKSVSVKLLRQNTLGRCFHDGKIELSPKILLMPEKYTDAIILHEMAHLKYHHHKQPFWNYLSALLGEDSKAQNARMDTDMSIRYLYLRYILKK